MSSDKVVAILRFMPQKRVDSFLSGELHLNTLEYFAELEGDSVRSDIHEGAHYAWQLTQIEMADDDGKFLSIPFVNPVSSRTLQPSGVNLLSMYAITEPRGFRVDEQNFCFGDSVVVILNPVEFFARVLGAAKKLGRKSGWKLVEYVDRSYEGPMGIFRKLSDLRYQQEMRLAVSGGDNKPLKLSIGDIRDICAVCPASHFRFGYIDVQADGRATVHVDARTTDGSPR
jgi:hypothetical protein